MRKITLTTDLEKKLYNALWRKTAESFGYDYNCFVDYEGTTLAMYTQCDPDSYKEDGKWVNCLSYQAMDLHNTDRFYKVYCKGEGEMVFNEENILKIEPLEGQDLMDLI